MREINQAVILAGGSGVRLRPFTLENPKAMYPFEGVPFLEYLIRQIRSFGIRRIVLLTGYLADKISGYFGDGSRWDVSITYSWTEAERETGYRLCHAERLLDDHFLLLYCDNYCPIDFEKAKAQYEQSGAKVQVTAYTNKDGYTKNNLKYDGGGMVERYDKTRRSEGLQAVDIGYALLDKQTLGMLDGRDENFEKEVYPVLAMRGELSVYLTDHRYYSVGSWERLSLTEAFFQPKKTVFLDRDGTVNRKPPKAQYVCSPDEFVWLDGAVEAIRLLKQSQYQIFMVTNQPGLARGALTRETLDQIHEKMREDLRRAGTDIDGIYVCPHGWDDGCECRKPRPGMLYQAQREHSLNLTKCILIGDDERDIQAARSAGCRWIQVGEENLLPGAVQTILREDREK